ncbi:MAG TPA: hypothetical protein VGJ45_27875 [Pseudonocardiaceae bacterium]
MLRSLAIGVISVSALALSQPVAAATVPGFSDNFIGTGLNDNLAQREAGDGAGPTGLVTYTRTSGLWYPAPPPPATYSEVVNDALTFNTGTSAVRLDAPATGPVTVTATITPTVGSTTDGDWSSVVLTNSSASAGYVSNADVSAAVLVTANGGVQLWSAGKEIGSGQVTPAASDSVSLVLGASNVTATVDGTPITATLPNPAPTGNWLYLGRYSDNTGTHSTVSGLTVSAIDNSALRQPAGANLKYFGYYPARITAADGDHVQDLAGHSNLSWIQISDPSGVDTATLSNCRPHSCVVYAANEFFSGCDGNDACTLYPNAKDRWAVLSAAIRPYLADIAAFYLLDEAYFRRASYADVSTSAQLIKADYPDVPIILNFAAPTLAGSFAVPADVDWVAFDQYCAGMTTVTNNLHALEKGAPGKDVLLFVQSAPLSACPANANTDTAIAAAQQNYLHLAQSDPRVTGLFEFGLWTSDIGPGVTTPANVPVTTDAQERIAAQLGV